MMKYFPEMVNNDEYVTQFRLEPRKKDEFLQNTKITPDIIKFKRPDFGFNDFMTFDSESEKSSLNNTQTGWRRFMDAVSLSPQNERVQNYIDFIH